MVCAMTNDGQTNGQVIMPMHNIPMNSDFVTPSAFQNDFQNTFQTNGQQLVLLPMMPMTPLAWQSNESAPGVDATTCYPQTPTAWAQPMVYADSDGSNAPQQYGVMIPIGMIALPAEMPVAADESMSPVSSDGYLQSGYSHECNVYAAETYGKPNLSASTARRQRRQRAAERAAARAKSEAARAAQPSSDASTSDGDESSIAALEGQTLEELMEQLNAGGEARRAAISVLSGSICHLARDREGCRVVQLALEVASSSEGKALVEELHGHVEDAIYSPHANYVIQKIIEAMPMPVSSFVAEELIGIAGTVARHRFGCRIFCRLLEHQGALGGIAAELINEVLADAEELVRHTFGHYVAKMVLEHGTTEQKQRIAYALRSSPTMGLSGVPALMRNAMHRNASYILEKALAHLPPMDAGSIAKELLSTGDCVRTLGQSPFGSHVVKGMLRINGVAEIVQAHLRHDAECLRASKYGSRLLEEVGLGVRAQ